MGSNKENQVPTGLWDLKFYPTETITVSTERIPPPSLNPFCILWSGHFCPDLFRLKKDDNKKNHGDKDGKSKSLKNKILQITDI